MRSYNIVHQSRINPSKTRKSGKPYQTNRDEDRAELALIRSLEAKIGGRAPKRKDTSIYKLSSYERAIAACGVWTHSVSIGTGIRIVIEPVFDLPTRPETFFVVECLGTHGWLPIYHLDISNLEWTEEGVWEVGEWEVIKYTKHLIRDEFCQSEKWSDYKERGESFRTELSFNERRNIKLIEAKEIQQVAAPLLKWCQGA